MRTARVAAAIFFCFAAAGWCQLEVSMFVPGTHSTRLRLFMENTGDDIRVQHFDVVPLAESTLLNAKAVDELQKNPLKDLNHGELARRAGAGDRDAQYYLGCCYDLGWQVERSAEDAVSWYGQAARRGHVHSMHLMGEIWLMNSSTAGDGEVWHLKAAEAGHPDAQCRAAYYYKFGYGVEQSNEKAFEYYRKAMAQDCAEALVNIGNMYYHGQGSRQDYAEAYRCFTQCLKQDTLHPFEPYLNYRLGTMYQQGLGTDVDYAKALKHYTAATELINSKFAPYACHRLAVMYEEGMGVEKNAEEAAKWNRIAAAKGFGTTITEPIEQQIGKMYPIESLQGASADNLESRAAAGDAEGQFQLAESYFLTGDEANLKKAVELFLKAAEQGHAEAQCRMGLVYSFGMGVEENQAEAFQWTLKSAEQGFAHAMSSVADMYHSGHGTERNYAAAMKWALKAADNGDRTIYALIGLMHAKGDGVEKSKAKAAEWLMKAAESGTTWGLYGMGLVYTLGRGLEKDPAEGLRWITKAAEGGDAQAEYYVGTAYMDGRGVAKDAQKAHQWFNRSIEAGHAVPGTYYRMALLCRDGVIVKKDTAETYKWLMAASHPADFPKFTPDYHLLRKADPESELDDAALEQMSGLSVPELAGVMKEISDQLTPEQVRTAQNRYKLFLKSNERNIQEQIRQINARESKRNKPSPL